MPYDQTIATRVERYLDGKHQRFESKSMMGGLVFMVNGKMCIGVEKNRIMLRIDPSEQAAALARKGCSPMDFTGRPMRGFVFVAATTLRTDAQLEAWLSSALAFNPKAVASKWRTQSK